MRVLGGGRCGGYLRDTADSGQGELPGSLCMWQGKLGGPSVGTGRSGWEVPWGVGQGELGLYVTEGHCGVSWGVWGTGRCGGPPRVALGLSR